MNNRDFRLKVRHLCLAAAIVFFGAHEARSQDTNDHSANPPEPAAPASASSAQKEEVTVVGATPVSGLGLERDQIPGNVEVVTAAEIGNSRDFTAAMERRQASVSANDVQGNSLVPDLQYRGFTASPLLGTPQGIAVYRDGVRLNEPFGDTVPWDTLPASSIATATLVPGSNPLFGLNALGGALSLASKNGFENSGFRAKASAGSFGGRDIALDGGAHNDQLSIFAAGNYLQDGGWRDFSPSTLRQLFADAGWRSGRGAIDLSFTAAHNSLTGNGATPVELLAERRSEVFTIPDTTRDSFSQIDAHGHVEVSNFATLTGNAYYRKSATSTANGDATDFAPCLEPGDGGILCDNSGPGETPVDDQNGHPVALGPGGADPYDAVINRNSTEQTGFGASFQFVATKPAGAMPNQFIAGLSFDGGNAGFRSKTELAAFNPHFDAQATGTFAQKSFVDVGGRMRDGGLFFMDSLSLTSRLAVVLSGRFDVNRIALTDHLGGALNGDHRFSRFNPAAGATYRIGRGASAYANYSESSRSPSPVELTCADPDAPCKLPNAFVADPPLKQVVARTAEIGYRHDLSWGRASVAFFRTVNQNDILFISSGAQTGAGYFRNVGDTRRQGIEISLEGSPAAAIRPFASYALLDATFRTAFIESSPNHPDAEEGELQVPAGARIPGIPRNSLRVGLEWDVTGSISMQADVRYCSSQYYRGDEANRLTPIPGYAVFDVELRARLHKDVSLFLSAENLFDRRYSTFGILGDATSVLGAAYSDPRFQSPGAPRSFRAGFDLKM